ncbi:MAG: LysR family transcriptional regulator [Oscillospiraceae bacterium]|nr:LysR family transcriptional regulator [Oscillospiraceae bacterium]
MFKNKEYILSVLREGSFSKAAERLYISQPSLSASVKRIEERLGAPIFDRATSPVTLTEVGEEYVRQARAIREHENDFERYLNDLTQLRTGSVRIGGSSLFASFMLPRMISDFNRLHPLVRFEIFEDSTKNLMERLRQGRLDLVLDNTKNRDDEISSLSHSPELLLLAVPKSFEINKRLSHLALTDADIKNGKHLANAPRADLSAFRDEPFILLNPENDTGKRAARLFKKHGITPNVIFSLDQQVTAYNISSTGMGISFISDTLVRYTDSAPALFFYVLKDEEIRREVSFYMKRNHYLSLACRKFLEDNAQGYVQNT